MEPLCGPLYNRGSPTRVHAPARGDELRFPAVLCLCAFLLAGCGGIPEDGSKPEDPGRTTAKIREPAPETARIECGKDGTNVITPEVRARPDGVHFEISNRLGNDAGYAIVTSSGGMGSNAPKGTSSHLGDIPPGKVRIGCHASMNEPFDYANLTVLAGSSGYRSVELECPGGRAVTSGGGLYEPGTAGENEKPVALVRERFPDQLEDDDIVQDAGYPESRDRSSVRAVRGGRVVAVFEFRRVESGWLDNGYSACAGF